MLNSQIREGCWWNETLMPQLTSFSAMLASQLPKLLLHHLSELLLGVWRRPCIFDKAIIKQRHHVCVHFLSFSSTDSQTVEREHVLETSSVIPPSSSPLLPSGTYWKSCCLSAAHNPKTCSLRSPSMVKTASPLEFSVYWFSWSRVITAVSFAFPSSWLVIYEAHSLSLDAQLVGLNFQWELWRRRRRRRIWKSCNFNML